MPAAAAAAAPPVQPTHLDDARIPAHGPHMGKPHPLRPSNGANPVRNAVAGQEMAAAPESFTTPDWVKDAIFYQVFPDRFFNGDIGNDPAGTQPWGSTPTNEGFMGGDLNGLTQKLGYLKSLGVNALYMNPVFTAPSNHKYNTTDYDNVDPHFGGNAALRSLSDAASRNGMKVVLDGVFNHTSHQHKWFADVREKGPRSAYFDRYAVQQWPISYTRDKDGILRSDDYKSWWGYATLPELKTDHPKVRDYFLTGKDAVVKRWLRDYGISGWRMDVADEVEPEFWREARKQIKAVNPDAYLLAENWHDASSMLQGDQFDGAMNYKHFQIPAVDFFARKKITTDEFVRALDNNYPREAKYAMFNLLGSHDTSRFVTEAGGDWYRMRPAAIFQMTYVGAPVIYYGDELGLEGGKDPDSRRAFPWDRVSGNPVKGDPHKPEATAQQPHEQIFDLYRTLTTTRTNEPVLRRGDFSVLTTHNDNRTFAFRRALPGQERDAVVAINNDIVGHDVAVPMGQIAADGTRYVDAISGRPFTVKDGQLVVPKLEGNFGAVLLREVPAQPAR